jgi:hypothetical protein
MIHFYLHLTEKHANGDSFVVAAAAVGTQQFPSLTFEVLAAMNMKITVFWDVMLCNHVGCYQCFGGMLLPSSRTHLP